MNPIDWKSLDDHPRHRCRCACGVVFQSHTKITVVDERMVLLAREPCPGCGRADTLRSASSGRHRETVTLNSTDVGCIDLDPPKP